ncbi:dihydroorotase [Fulvivirga sedimenti]|uniref:Dihydroorotase n=1 Tax=Fulvivirga sedimenti TaxID=2879465 RepID=A0A9X1L390_9BACT|nr:dihydroorotase [Fulvivirga sedimenti]MCA6079036.1 dihydroorotase [Fulvivirga sedimenti]
MRRILITNARIVNEGNAFYADILIEGQFIKKIEGTISDVQADEVIDASGLWALPGLIDDQVHFREPGLTHKGDLFTESRAAVAGGVTSFMEMPNTVPNALTQDLLEQKYHAASQKSLANYSFFMGASNDNLEEVLKTDGRHVCGVKIFMGSSTGNMLVDDGKTLEGLFSKVPLLIATHCEDEATIRKNTAEYRKKYGEDVPIECHPLIRSEEACYKSSSFAVELAKKYNTRLHILHISTAKELSLFRNDIPLEEKRITAEACIHHLWFSDEDYREKGTLIKWNPAVKKASDRDAIFQAVLDGRIDVVATDHAPHTRQEKENTYFKAPSGGPLVQHSLVAMMEMYHRGKITPEQIVEKMCHNPAKMFKIDRRGYIREGYYADLVLVHPEDRWTVRPDNILYKCGWSPFEGQEFKSKVHHTIVSGNWSYRNGRIHEGALGERLAFLVDE